MSKHVFRNTLLAGSLALITGATGFSGQCLAKNLLTQNVRVRALVRPDGDLRSLKGLPVEWIEGKLWDADQVGKALRDVNYVFHLASPYRRPAESAREHYNVHVRSTEVLARAAQRESGFRRFVHVSTVGVHGHIEHPPADENYPFSTEDYYQQTKLEAEQWIRSFAADTGLPITVVRPAGIYGPGDERLFKVFKMATYPVVPMIGSGRCLYHLIHVDDLVDFYQVAAVHPDARNKVYICASRHAIGFEEFVRTAGALYGVRNRFVRLPGAPVMSVARACEWLCQRLGLTPPIYPRRIAFYTKDRAFDASRMTRELGFRTRIENKQGIADVARWYVENGWIRRRQGMRV